MGDRSADCTTLRSDIPSRRRLGGFIDGTDFPVRYQKALDALAQKFGNDGSGSRVVRALAACLSGAPPDEISGYLTWREFEAFAASMLRASGFEVQENLILTKPRLQVDLLARGASVALAVDCKHWTRSGGEGALRSAVAAQGNRAKRLRSIMGDLEPMVVVLLLLSNEPIRYVEGGAVVPVHTLPDFLNNLSVYSSELDSF